LNAHSVSEPMTRFRQSPPRIPWNPEQLALK
jgi:hypothetical protein